MHVSLADKVVLVTGAGRGIGRALAEAMAASGAAVAVHYHRRADAAEALAHALGGGAFAVGADLEHPDACRRLYDAVLARYGRLDVLVNNAAIAEALPLDMPLADWQTAWDRAAAVNLRAPELLCRLALPHFLARGGGRILNVASRAAFRGDTPDYLVYAETKAGLVALTRSLARAFGRRGVFAFTLAPGFTRTDMAQDFIDRYGEAFALQDLAADRLTEPRDIAPFAVLLASGLADHATGCTIDINAASYVH